MRGKTRRVQSNADTKLAGQVLSAILAWTAVGAVALFALSVIPSVFRLVPLPDAVVVAIAVLRAGLSGVTLGLVFAGWMLGVLTICTLAALRRLWREPVVIPWTNRPTLGRSA